MLRLKLDIAVDAMTKAGSEKKKCGGGWGGLNSVR